MDCDRGGFKSLPYWPRRLNMVAPGSCPVSHVTFGIGASIQPLTYSLQIELAEVKNQSNDYRAYLQ